jgi:hypothetical protein
MDGVLIESTGFKLVECVSLQRALDLAPARDLLKGMRAATQGRKQPRGIPFCGYILKLRSRRNEFGSHWSGVEFILGDSLGNLGAELNFSSGCPAQRSKRRKRVHDKEISTVEWLLCFFIFCDFEIIFPEAIKIVAVISLP